MAKLITDHEFYCCKCGKRGLPIIRKAGQEREAGHLKKLYCFNCKKEINHAECVPYSKYDYNEFLLEYKYGNFDNEQNRILPFGKFKTKIHNKGVDIHEKS